jgi:glycosyltransferase involved in cell wall biosynthesis
MTTISAYGENYLEEENSIPVFSIITPVYNGQEYIRETIESVIDMTANFSVEYIVVDDGSTDDTPSILNHYKNRIRVISQNNSGESHAVNIGLNEARGKIALIVSDDDPLFTDELFQDVEQVFSANPNLVCLYSDWRIIDQLGSVVENQLIPDYSEHEMIGKNRVLPGPGAFFRISTARSIGGRNPKRVFTGDYDFWLRLSRQGDFVHRSKILAQWRSHPDSTSISQRGSRMAEERIAVMRDFISSNRIEESLARMALANSYYLAARLCFFDKTVKGRTLLIKSIIEKRGIPNLLKLHEALFIVCSPFSNSIFELIRKLQRGRIT